MITIMASAFIVMPMVLPQASATVQTSCFQDYPLCNEISQYGICFNGGTGNGSYDISFTLASLAVFPHGSYADCGPGEIEICGVSPTPISAVHTFSNIIRVRPSTSGSFTLYVRPKVYSYALDPGGLPIKNSSSCTAFGITVNPSDFSGPGCLPAFPVTCP